MDFPVTKLRDSIDRRDNTSEDDTSDYSINVFDAFFCNTLFCVIGKRIIRHRIKLFLLQYSIVCLPCKIYSPIFMVFEKKVIFGTWIITVL